MKRKKIYLKEEEMKIIRIETRQEYDYAKSRGYDPLLSRFFEMDIKLRVDVQREIFGKSFTGRGNVVSGNDRFYHYCWDNKIHVCEECMKPIENYASIHISHIITRGSHPEMGHDPRNVNILCEKHHRQWESLKREKMRIYRQNMRTESTLRAEYNSLKL